MMGDTRAQIVGVVGLGRMGLPVCERLMARGFDVVCTDLDDQRRPAAARAGAGWLSGAAAVAESADVVVTILPGAAEVRSVAEELAGAMAPGSIWIDMSTASPRPSPPAGIRAIDAPVGGGPDAARAGRLLSFVGADDEDLEAARPVLEAMADRIVHVGPPGSGYVVKLLANTLWFEHAVAVSEALTLARRAGLDADLVRQALARSAAASRFLTDDAVALLGGDNLTTFSLARCCEQLASVLALGDELAVEMEVAGAVSEVHRRALAHYGEVDGELLGARFVADRAGVSFAPGS
jgi:3-hydroxyisobutyrate dehydrogenase-like beta-hydroxyacid dehydrogenase